MKHNSNLKNSNYFQNVFRHYTTMVLLLSVAFSVYTYSQITNNYIFDLQQPKLIITLIIDLVLLLTLSFLVTRKILRIWQRSKNQSGKLQNKIIFMFCLVAAVPTIIVTVFSTIFFNFGIQSWFDQRVSTAIAESVEVADSYFWLSLNTIDSDVRIMSRDINNFAANNLSNNNPKILTKYLSTQAEDKQLVEAIIFTTDPKHIISESRYNFSIPFNIISEEDIKKADRDVLIIYPEYDSKARAIVKLDFMPNCYLLIGRTVDEKVLQHMENTKGAAGEYKRLKTKLSNLQIKFLMIFIVVSLILVFAAIWLGLILSSALIKPLNSLVSATKQIIEGDFNININVKDGKDEISVLSRAFNGMALELNDQRDKLITAHHEVEAKSNFSDAVLSGVSAGIVALDLNGKISAINPTAIKILSLDHKQNLINQDFSLLCPEIGSILPHALNFIGQEVKKEIIINREDKKSILIVRIISERTLGKTEGHIITFDDVTALVIAQRSAAWSDVARKIAHEIKNPLTPIYLAAERLRKKYSKEVSDPNNFEKYIEIISKHVKDIGTMVEEFVQFARMPAPNFEDVNFSKLLIESIFLRKCLEKNINYITHIDIDEAIVNVDARQINQVLLNLFKNAEESIEQSINKDQGEIIVKLSKPNKLLELEIIDNGSGFSDELFERLTEPYITNKSTGTGLGLAIVKKILDDHNIDVYFKNNYSQGAIVKLTFKETRQQQNDLKTEGDYDL